MIQRDSKSTNSHFLTSLPHFLAPLAEKLSRTRLLQGGRQVLNYEFLGRCRRSRIALDPLWIKLGSERGRAAERRGEERSFSLSVTVRVHTAWRTLPDDSPLHPPPSMGVDTSCQMSLGQTFLYLNSSFA